MSLSKSKGIYEILGRNAVHPFPARMAPDLALQVVAESEQRLRVLDPMAGSGTVLAIARSRGHHAIGVDIDPLAVLIARVWTTPLDSNVLREQAVEVLSHARKVFVSLRTRDAYPQNSDEETRRFVRYWFDDYARRQLASLGIAISEVLDDTSRDALWCAFSRLIISKQSGASLAMDLSHSRPHRSFRRAPSKPFRKFLLAVNRVAKNCIDPDASTRGPAATVQEGDARHLPIDDASINLVLTSPPYLNAIDYIRCSKFSLVWMGHSIEELRRRRSTSVGTEVGLHASNNFEVQEVLSDLDLRPKLPGRYERILMRYVDDMRRVIGEIERVLAGGGKAVFVVGENTLRGTFIPNSRVVEMVADRLGLCLASRSSRELPANRRYLPPPSKQSQPAALNARMRREAVLTFRKAA